MIYPRIFVSLVIPTFNNICNRLNIGPPFSLLFRVNKLYKERLIESKGGVELIRGLEQIKKVPQLPGELN